MILTVYGETIVLVAMARYTYDEYGNEVGAEVAMSMDATKEQAKQVCLQKFDTGEVDEFELIPSHGEYAPVSSLETVLYDVAAHILYDTNVFFNQKIYEN